jgi:hypothetical protein
MKGVHRNPNKEKVFEKNGNGHTDVSSMGSRANEDGFICIVCARTIDAKEREVASPLTQHCAASTPAVMACSKKADLAEGYFLLLKAYHDLSLGQSRLTVWFSLVFAALGFLVIVTGLMDGSLLNGLLRVVSGVTMNAVASLFFVQSNKARELMTAFFDKLRSDSRADRQLDESLELVREIPDAALKARLMATLALRFAGIKPENDILSGRASRPRSSQ